MIDDIDIRQDEDGYCFGFLDEQTKRIIRRAILKAVSIPGYQVPFGDREVPLPPGWGTGGIQVTASIIGLPDRLKVIDQGADDTTNAVSIRRFFAHVAGAQTTEHTGEATIIQSRHRIPERKLEDNQILVMQVPQPEPLRRLITSEEQSRKLHAFARYGVMQVRLYEDIARYGHIVMSHDYPVRVHARYLSSPSPVPKFDNPKLNHSRALTIFGAGRERRIYAIPPFTDVQSLDFEDHPFEVQKWSESCALCGATDSYLDEALLDDVGTRQFVCSDTSYCNDRQSEGASR
ncbi:alpha-D-ribose 1-methylphosphonate 5-phosphate C-P-lyase PhnJ [Rhizobium miluonense]|uniref:Alpha-D-ribose 1-methylphosphonate 5-phosphate C-P lyase n=1 Tax=Rhizobium miluonense TaxID=411945 RepID=A0A1C3WDU6_9HYPH|nr:alpha-D-ribose 1-methylphosphonate 5-phosphate C-P-lyase PhnJ [Rhizobium miluonense]SCB38229.1 alpha-D-ribose 1-methylphosphonate 5-phosphate C-P lyase [Rhizobium miluonense]